MSAQTQREFTCSLAKMALGNKGRGSKVNIVAGKIIADIVRSSLGQEEWTRC